MFKAVEHDKFQQNLINKHSISYKKQKTDEFLLKIDKLTAKIAALKAKKVKTASNLLQLKNLQEELEATEDLMKRLLSDGEKEDLKGSRDNTASNSNVQPTRDDLIRKGILNPLDKQQTDHLEPAENTSDIFLYDKSEEKDYCDDGVEEYYRKRYFTFALERYKTRTGDQDMPSVQILKQEEFIPTDSSGDHQIDR